MADTKYGWEYNKQDCLKLLDTPGFFHIHLAVEWKWNGRVARIHMADPTYIEYEACLKLTDIVIMREIIEAEYDNMTRQIEDHRSHLRSKWELEALKAMDEYIQSTIERISGSIRSSEKEAREDMASQSNS